MNPLRLKGIVTNLNNGLERPVFQMINNGITFLGVVIYTQESLAPYMTDSPALTEYQAVMALVAIGLAQITNTITQVSNSMLTALVTPMGDQEAVDTMIQVSAGN